MLEDKRGILVYGGFQIYQPKYTIWGEFFVETIIYLIGEWIAS